MEIKTASVTWFFERLFSLLLSCVSISILFFSISEARLHFKINFVASTSPAIHRVLHYFRLILVIFKQDRFRRRN